jgi:hypothetical protein
LLVGEAIILDIDCDRDLVQKEIDWPLLCD